MKKYFLILFTVALLVFLIIYLNRSYSRIYDYNNTPSVSAYKTSKLLLTNPDFKQVVKYVALGDSLSSGMGSNDYKKTVTYIFADKLSKNSTVDFTNLAVSGATTVDLINFQLDEAIKIKPDYITLFIGTNDIHNLLPANVFQQNMVTIVDKLQNNTNAKIIVFNIPYLGDPLILPPYNFLLDARIKEFNSIIDNICLNKNLALIDIYNPTKNDFSKRPDFYSSDKFHPSENGYLLWGTLINNRDF